MQPSTNKPEETGQLLLAKKLVESLESGDDDSVHRIMLQLAEVRESRLFVELGKLTRELHDALGSFRVDSKVTELAEKDFVDAKERLNYVISMTEQSANATLAAVEEGIPLSEEMESRADALKSEWMRFRERQMNVEEFRELSRSIDDFLLMIHANSGAIRSKLSDVVMAQGYQDLTGQIIRKVIDLVQDVEHGLVEMIRLSGKAELVKTKKHDPRDELQGPAVPGLADADTLNSQDEVDDLLSSLGF